MDIQPTPYPPFVDPTQHIDINNNLYSLRRGVRIELRELKEQLTSTLSTLQKEELGLSPPSEREEQPGIWQSASTMVKLLSTWHEKCSNFLENYETHYSKEVHAQFVEQLEEMFKNPILGETPYHSDLFSESPPPLVKFLIGKMMNCHSLFFSEKIHSAAPKKGAPPLSFSEFPDDFEEQMRLINAIQKERDQIKQEAIESAPKIQEINNRFHQIERGERARYAETAKVVNACGLLMREETEKLRIHLEEKQKIVSETIARLQEEIRALKKETPELVDHVQIVKREIVSAEHAAATLKVSMNELDIQIKEQQNDWALGVLKIAAYAFVSYCGTWGLSMLFEGAVVQVTPGMLSTKILF